MARITVDGPGGLRTVVVTDDGLIAELVRKFNATVDNDGGAEPTADETVTDIDSMKVDELRDFAEANDIDLDGATLKADIRGVIEAALEAGDNDDEPGTEPDSE